MGRKIRIAFTGVFDLANYGDHLFPNIFENQMKKRGLECEITLFSVFACEQAFEEGRHVYSIYNIDKMHIENAFDAVIVGGGELIHYGLYQHIFEGRYVDYPIFDLWVVPCLFVKKYHVKLIWNAPGIPFDFEKGYSTFTKWLLEGVDYLAVRNIQSKMSLVKCGIDVKRISVIPDTGLLLKDVYSRDECVKETTISIPQKKYVVIHTSKLMPENDRDIFKVCLENLMERGFKLILLPLAYTNDDDEILKRLNASLNYKCIVLDKRLKLEDIVRVISGCDLYIGFSYHGAITAFCFGKKAIVYNYTQNRKTIDLFDSLKKGQYCIDSAEKLLDAIEGILSEPPTFNENLSGIEADIEKHFDKIENMLNSSNISDSEHQIESAYRAISDILSAFSSEKQIQAKNTQDIIANWNKTQKQLDTVVQEWSKCSEELKKSNMALEGTTKELEKSNMALERTTKELEKSNMALEGMIKELELFKKETQRLQKSQVSWQEYGKMIQKEREVRDAVMRLIGR
ncbi:hypothetical protein D7Y05_04285 [bacterium 1XD42-54]|nr:hypothetical protein D7Y05_04285 [bacterium 1XD42-54]